MKKLCTFYCEDCDNAWLELFDLEGENHERCDKCDFCGKKCPPEEIE